MRYYSFALLVVNLIILLIQCFMLVGLAVWPEDAGGNLYWYLAVDLLFIMCASLSACYILSFLRDKIGQIGYLVYPVFFLNAAMLIGALLYVFYVVLLDRYSLSENITWSLPWIFYPVLNIIHSLITAWRKFRATLDEKQHSFWTNFDRSN